MKVYHCEHALTCAFTPYSIYTQYLSSERKLQMSDYGSRRPASTSSKRRLQRTSQSSVT